MRAALLAIGLIGIVACSSSSHRASRQPPAPASVERIRTHKFWREEMTAERVEEILAIILEQKRSAVVWIDDQGRALLMDPKRVDAFRGYKRDDHTVMSGMAPDGLSDRKFHIDMADYQRAPSREQILADLLIELDHADFKN